jgi:hypothetical protein
VAIVDRCGCVLAEILVDPGCWRCLEIVGSKLQHPRVVTAVIVRLLEKTRGEDAKSQISQHARYRQRPGRGCERLIQYTALE